VAFDEIWFGDRPATPADVAVARAAADDVVSARIAETVAASSGYALPW